MPLLPQGAPLTFTQTANSYAGNFAVTLYVNEIKFETVTQAFDRPEFSNTRLRTAPTSTGAQPIIVTSFGNQPMQLAVTCTGDSPRPLVPDDANLNAIKQRFDIERFIIKGAPTLASDVDQLFGIQRTHKSLLAKFDAHLAIAGSSEVSYAYIVSTLQAENFAYLTNTGLVMSSPCLGGTDYGNCLLVSFQEDIAYAVDNPDTSVTILKTFDLVVEHRTIQTAQNVGF